MGKEKVKWLGVQKDIIRSNLRFIFVSSIKPWDSKLNFNFYVGDKKLLPTASNAPGRISVHEKISFPEISLELKLASSKSSFYTLFEIILSGGTHLPFVKSNPNKRMEVPGNKPRGGRVQQGTRPDYFVEGTLQKSSDPSTYRRRKTTLPHESHPKVLPSVS